MESIIYGCGKFNRIKDKDLIESRSALVQAWIDDVERAVEKVDKNLPDMMARHIADICYRESERLKKQITMERKIGEIFEYKGEWYQCVEGYHCYDCDFRHENGTCIIYANYPESKMGNCNGDYRTDNQNVVFKKLEKVGEPFTGKVHIQLQRYKIYTKPKINSTENVGYIDEGNTIAIEIKQDKEDMEEKKQKLDKLVDDYMACRIQYAEFDKEIKALYDKEESEPTLKEFDLEAAKQGRPVCTRDGRKARIICFDRRGDKFPIVALLDGCNEEHSEVAETFTNEGLYEIEKKSSNDLMMLPEKKEMWINIYKGATGPVPGGCLYNTKEEAKDAVKDLENYVTTTKACWEE